MSAPAGIVVVGVAFCPHPPVLIPALAGTVALDMSALLTACDEAVKAATADADEVVVLGAAPRTAWYPVDSPGGLGRFGGQPTDGLDADNFSDTPTLPLPLAIGRWLVERQQPFRRSIRLFGVGDGDDPLLLGSGRVAVVAMGDGSARRGLKAPGYLDDRADGFDAAVRAALTAGDADALAALDRRLGTELLAAGVPVWIATGRLVAGQRWRSAFGYDGDPFGVQYFTAAWTPAS